jgi:excisionase family DNA binding protein
MIARLRPILTSLKPKTLLPLADLVLVNAAVLAGLWLWTVRDDFRVFNAQFVLTRIEWFLVFSAAWLLVAVIQDFYQPPITQKLQPCLITLFGITSLLLVVYFAIYFFAPRNNVLPRGVVLSMALISFFFVGIWRLSYIGLTTGLSRQEVVAAIAPKFRRPAAEPDSRATIEEPAPITDQVLTVQEVAERLKVSQATVWRWCQSGKLPAFRVGQQWRIRAADLQVMMSANGKGLEG